MLQRRLALSFVALAAVGLLGTACADQSAAIKVGDRTLSDSDFQDELRAIWDNEVLWESQDRSEIEGDAPGSYDQIFVAQIIEQDIQTLIAEEIFEDQGLELTDADREAVLSQVEASPEDARVFDAFTHGYRDRYVDTQAMFSLLQQADDQFEERFFELAENAEIEIDPRYGTFDRGTFIEALTSQQGQAPLSITPPAGPAPNPEADADADGDVDGEGDVEGSGQGSGEIQGG